MRFGILLRGILLVFFGIMMYSIDPFSQSSHITSFAVKSVGSTMVLAGFGISMTAIITRKTELYRENLQVCRQCESKMPSFATYCGICGKKI